MKYMMASTFVLMNDIREACRGFVFRCRSEADLQAAVVARVRAEQPDALIDTEVRVKGGRFDVLVARSGVALVLEMKMRASVSAVERQAQRYALLDEVDGVMVVTTSSQLAIKLNAHGAQLGGKAFGALAVRTS
jgi:hypothetical protein